MGELVEAMEPTGRSYRFLIVGIAVTLAVALLVFRSMQGNTAYYLKVSELLGEGTRAYNQEVRVSGKVLPGSIHRTPTLLTFTAYDPTGRIKVEYGGVVPDIFKENIDVVVEGKYDPQGVFEASTLLAKCPSKYQSSPSGSSS